MNSELLDPGDNCEALMVSCRIVPLYRIEELRMVVNRVLLFSIVLLTQNTANGVIAYVAIDDPILVLIQNLENWAMVRAATNCGRIPPIHYPIAIGQISW